MTRRSAFAIASGVVGAIVSAVAAVSIAFQSAPPLPAAATGKVDPGKHQKPIIRKRTRTITIHKKPKGGSGGPRLAHFVQSPSSGVTSGAPAYVPAHSPGSATTTSTGGSHPGTVDSDDGEQESSHESAHSDD